MGKGQDAAGLRDFFAGVAAVVFLAALAAALETGSADFLVDLLGVVVSVIWTSFLDDFVAFLPALATVLAAFFAAAAFFTAEVEVDLAAAVVLLADFLAADFTPDFAGAFFATVLVAADWLAVAFLATVLVVFTLVAVAFLAAVFLATAFLAVVFFTGVFLAATLFAALALEAGAAGLFTFVS